MWFAKHHTVHTATQADLTLWSSHPLFAAAGVPPSGRGAAFAIRDVLGDVPVRVPPELGEEPEIASDVESLDGLHTQRGRRPAKAGEWAKLVEGGPEAEFKEKFDQKIGAGGCYGAPYGRGCGQPGMPNSCGTSVECLTKLWKHMFHFNIIDTLEVPDVPSQPIIFET